MEAAVVDDRVTGVAETRVTRVATVVECCTVVGAATGADEVESTGGKPKMEARLEVGQAGVGKADWVLDTLEYFPQATTLLVSPHQ